MRLFSGNLRTNVEKALHCWSMSNGCRLNEMLLSYRMKTPHHPTWDCVFLKQQNLKSTNSVVLFKQSMRLDREINAAI